MYAFILSVMNFGSMLSSYNGGILSEMLGRIITIRQWLI